jgi:hypothetical protein
MLFEPPVRLHGGVNRSAVRSSTKYIVPSDSLRALCIICGFYFGQCSVILKHVEAIFRHLGAILGLSGAIWGPSGGHVGPSGAEEADFEGILECFGCF